MPFWIAAEPYSDLIKRDPRPLRIALSHNGATTARRRRSSPSSNASAVCSKASAITSNGRCPRSTFAPPSTPQTTCYISNFARGDRQHAGSSRAGAAAGGSGRADQHPDLGSRPAHLVHRAGTHAGGRSTPRRAPSARSSRMGYHPDADHRAADAENRHDRISRRSSDNPSVLDWFGNLWQNFAYTPLANLCGIPAISLPLAEQEQRLCRSASRPRPGRPMTGCCCNWRRRSSARSAASGMPDGSPPCT